MRLELQSTASAVAVLEAHLAAAQADLEAGLVPPGSRALMEHERAAGVHFAAMEDELAALAARLLAVLSAHRRRFAALYASHLAGAAHGGPLAIQQAASRALQQGLAEIPGAADLLAEAEVAYRPLVLLATQAGFARVLDEAATQGVPVAEVAFHVTDTLVGELERAVGRLAAGPLNDMHRALYDALYAASPGSAAEVHAAVEAAAGAVSEARLEADYARPAVQQADGAGRGEGGRAVPRPARIYASELLDRNTCVPCSHVDGHEYATEEEALDDYPHGTYWACEGGVRCRGTLVYVWDTEAPATVDTRFHKPGPPGPGPEVPGLPH